MTAENDFGYKILTFLRGEQTGELTCQNRAEAERMLYSLTDVESYGIIYASDSDAEVAKLDYDVAELHKNGKLIALGLKPEKRKDTKIRQS